MSVSGAASTSRALGWSRAVDGATRSLLWLLAGLNVAFLVALLLSGGETSLLVNVWLSLLPQWIPVVIFWLIAARARFRQAPVVLAAVGVTANALGDTYYSLAMDAEGYLPFPSPADAGYLLFYPLMMAAVLWLARPWLQGAGGLVLLETAVATVGASAVLAVILDPVIQGAVASDDPLGSVIALAYPVFDLLLLALLAGIASVVSARIMRRWWALITGLGIFVVADIVYALLEDQGAYIAGTPLDATWTIGLAFITWWGARVSRPDADSAQRRSVPLPLPGVAVVGGLVVLVVATQVRLSVLPVVLAAITVGLGAVPIVFRQAMLGRMLADQEEAVRRLTELDQDKTDIMVTLNHEFRTPLTSISGHVDLLLDGAAGDLPPAADGMLRTIERNGARLESLIEAMLTVSVLERDDRLDRVPTDVGALVLRAVAEVEPRARSGDVQVEVEPADADLTLDVDPAHLERAVANVIDNAVKFSGAGGRVGVSVRGRSDGGVEIRVRDSGMGIPADDVPRLFTRFFRAANVQNAAIPGVGLGLSIAHRVVEAHGGTIAVDSTLGSGTTVTIRLPHTDARERDRRWRWLRRS